ncbi:hypothetical protein CERZMDRAFT_89511 [Cercospora zeae-maydis SCOH1-5]|uniref:Uncharacterized protein n=1 Tax=Cercospora zeae-maydis SCOH1-5 TaxID=717836 RepID=A0A6A6FV52_9PEZI|nr:hypothetical protein CERZMDRAFT_89511 [Cercospora zeae-maydis SCOH1-5]
MPRGKLCRSTLHHGSSQFHDGSLEASCQLGPGVVYAARRLDGEQESPAEGCNSVDVSQAVL